jgi:acyl carrier protein
VQRDEQLVGDVRTVLSEELLVEVGSPELDLLDAGLVDSVGLVELIVALEERFRVSLPMEDLQIDDLRSVRRIAELIGRLGPPSLNGDGRSGRHATTRADDQSTAAG